MVTNNSEEPTTINSEDYKKNVLASARAISGRAVKPKMALDDEIYTINELSEHLRVHRATIYRLLRQGRLPGFRVGSDWRFSRSAIEQWERLQALVPQQPVARGRRQRGE